MFERDHFYVYGMQQRENEFITTDRMQQQMLVMSNNNDTKDDQEKVVKVVTPHFDSQCFSTEHVYDYPSDKPVFETVLDHSQQPMPEEKDVHTSTINPEYQPMLGTVVEIYDEVSNVATTAK